MSTSGKEYDRRLATETLKVIATLGYRIVPATVDAPSPASRGAGLPPG
jgi:hypothetical protein